MGGNAVFVAGIGFVNSRDLTCRFSGLAGIIDGEAHWISDELVTCDAPSAATGLASQVSLSFNGQILLKIALRDYFADVSIVRISPDHGPSFGGTKITIMGNQFLLLYDDAVRFRAGMWFQPP